MSETATVRAAAVYLTGDANPIVTPITPEAVIDKMMQALVATRNTDDLIFVRLPGSDGDAFVRPHVIAAILPTQHPDPDATGEDDTDDEW